MSNRFPLIFNPSANQIQELSSGDSLELTGNNIIGVGIITATSFVGDGSNLTGTGSSVTDDTSTNSELYPLFTDVSSGIVTDTNVSTTKLTYNPSSGTLTSVNFNATSDENLKTNIKTVENSLDIVNSLRGVSFDWKENGNSSYGVIAQEVEKLLPELVNSGKNKSVNYDGLVAILIEAIKELSQQVESLKNK